MRDEISYVTYAGNPEADREIEGRNVLFIDNETAQQVLSMEDCMDVIGSAYEEFGLGRATASRASHSVPSSDGQGWFSWDPMVSAITNIKAVAIRIKSDVQPFTEGRVEKYSVAQGKYCGLILLFSTEDGAPLAIMNDGHIQHMRVGAVGGLSAKYLAREDATTLGIYGTGGMATAHAWAIAKVRPIKTIKVYSPNSKHRKDFSIQMSREMGIKVLDVEDPREVMEGADIVAACTNSLIPVALGDWLEPGMHILSVIPNELDDKLLSKCDRYVYSRTPTTEYYVADPERRPVGGSYESADSAWLLREEKLLSPEKMAFLSDVILGNAVARANDKEITCFISQGIPIQFTATAMKVYQLAREQNLGKKLPLAWFLQDIST